MSNSDQQLEISTSNHLIWFHLYDNDNGLPFKGTSATFVTLPSSAVIAQFRDAVKVKYSDNHLKGIDGSDLKVFKNKIVFDKRNSKEEKEEPLKSSSRTDGLGENEEDALIVVPMNLSAGKDPSLLEMIVNPIAASGMSASKMNAFQNCGYNGSLPFTFNLPEIVKNAIGPRDIDRDAIAVIKSGRVFSMAPILAEGTTKKALLGYLNDTPCSLLKGVIYTSLVNVNVPAKNLCVAQTVTDLAVIELTNICKTPSEILGQANESGCNIILSYLKLGIPFEECAVPLVLTNGNLYQFGWITLLKPSFPVLHLITGILDVNIYLEKISAHLAALKSFCKEMAVKINSLLSCQPKSDIPKESGICLSTDFYHLKPKDTIFYRFKDTDESFYYLWEIYEALKEVSEVVKPLTYAEYNAKYVGNCSSLIFSNLKGYSMGVPLDENLFNSYLAQMKKFLDTIHKCNVIHMNLYPSNILWKQNDTRIELRVVDWDVATFNHDSFSENIQAQLQDQSISQYYYKKIGPAEPKCDYWFMYILSLLNHEEKKEMNDDTTKVNNVFRDVVDRCSLESGGRDILRTKFETWYIDRAGSNMYS